MNYIKTAIPDVWILEPKVFEDARGYFMETYRAEDFDKAVGYSVQFIQDNQSMSTKGVLRGLHYQKGEASQAKLVRVLSGSVVDVAVDLRKDSPTFGKYVAVELTEDNHRQLFVPRGFAHGFSVLSEEVIFQYKCDNLYAPESEGAIAWNDPDIGIDWQLPAEDVLLSAKDSAHPMLKDATDLFDYNVDYHAE
jgi:dTDP-4-dehydrorhamnose 3,5-epimerase